MPENYFFNQDKAKHELYEFFKKDKAKLNSFGSRVNQTFEAHVFLKSVNWYQKNGWTIVILNPPKKGFILKFNTRGKPSNYSYALCKKDNLNCQIRHQLRVETKSNILLSETNERANICCDIAIIKDENLDYLDTDMPVSNDLLLSFGEVKHMSAYAELVANFIGLVHELMPVKLENNKNINPDHHLTPFLFVSGKLYKTAKGIYETIKLRKFDIKIYSIEEKMV